MPDYQSNRFVRKPFQKGGFDRGPKQMYKADCAKCGSGTEVPFRPNGKKPVYCSNCFVKDESPQQRSYGAPRREFSPRPQFDRGARPSFNRDAAPRDDRAIQDVKAQLADVNAKLSRLITLMESAAPAPKKAEAAPKAAKKAAAPKKAAKKAKKK